MLPDGRGISPPVGVALLLAIVVILAVISGTIILSLSEEKESPPNARILLETEESNFSIALAHGGGEQINGDRVEIQGAADPEALAGQNFSTTDTQRIIPVKDTVEVVWHDADGETSHVIWEGSVPEWATDLESATAALDTLSIGGQGADATVTEGDNETATVDVENVGRNTGSFAVSLDIGEEVSETATTADLSTGESETVSFENVTGDLSSDDYDVSASTDDDSASGALTVEADIPTADRGCDWVDNETDGGTDDIKVDGIIVDCDVTTDKFIEVQNGGGIIGHTESELKAVDADDARFWGNLTAEDVLNVQNGTITGDATSQTSDVKLGEASVEGSVDAEKVAELTSGTVVEGDMESAKNADVLGSSTVEGSVTASENAKVDSSNVGGTVEATDLVEVVSSSSVAGDAVSDTNVKVISSDVSGSVASDGSVKLQDATVTGDVYVDSSSFDCSSSTINGQDCGSYTPKDPDDY